MTPKLESFDGFDKGFDTVLIKIKKGIRKTSIKWIQMKRGEGASDTCSSLAKIIRS